ncbi:hypothetical protein ABIE45_002651 [Methylobacterium sp. OAE515]|uniref:hypothetical protein n=1 Tax=Methylobacterium sp. OAE515 TaxID=2817895 RepID=UPI001789289D
MPEPDPPNLFDAAGLVLEEHRLKSEPISRRKRPRKPKPPTPAERAAAARLEGGRRSRAPSSLGQRSRVSTPRDLSSAPVLAFPLSRNASVLSATVESLPHFYDDAFEKKWVKIGRNVERRLIRRGITPADALNCAHELLDAALDVRATQAESERKRG